MSKKMLLMMLGFSLVIGGFWAVQAQDPRQMPGPIRRQLPQPRKRIFPELTPELLTATRLV